MLPEAAEALGALLEQLRGAVEVAGRGRDGAQVAEPAGDTLGVAEVAPEREHLPRSAARPLEVAAAERDRAGGRERLRAQRRLVDAAESPARRRATAGLDEVAAHLPVGPERGREPEREVGGALLQRPAERRAHVVVLMLDPVEPGNGVAARQQVGFGRLRQLHQPFGVASAHGVAVLTSSSASA